MGDLVTVSLDPRARCVSVIWNHLGDIKKPTMPGSLCVATSTAQ